MDDLHKKINDYIASEPARFHMPGHKGKLDAFDITELSFSDNLHAPIDGIKEIGEKCAKAYSADEAFLLVNGSSGGITGFHIALALLKGSDRPRVALGRDAHRSAVSACALSGAYVIGIDVPSYNDGAPGAVRAEDIDAALSLNAVDAVCITSPNYYGVCADIEAISRVTKRHGALLFVDCAHGAHFPYSKRLPDVPTHADAFVVSTHKTLYAYNQTALLLINNAERLPRETVQSALAAVQTTSPSYPLMLSIDEAVKRAQSGEWDAHIDRIIKLRSALFALGVSVLSADNAKKADVTRLTVSARSLARDGYTLYKLLEQRSIYAEMADMSSVVFITTPSDDDKWYERLYNALSDIKKGYSGDTRRLDLNIPSSKTNPGFTDIRQACMGSFSEWVDEKKAIGQRAASAIGVYPPGTSLVFPGEIISDEVVRVLAEYKSAGADVFGARDGCIKVIK